ncbi:heat shock 70 kDa protein 12A-like [Schistocerca cancellata]|uniref:heat shock 70 kDa protein 12A-like n=1 Tax=Schistocerca cancellata TaxID=274614 RepID=UPI0021182B78|nr:heat shock 70 kDa protein 12A-like [Schistocerca cancellata]
MPLQTRWPEGAEEEEEGPAPLEHKGLCVAAGARPRSLYLPGDGSLEDILASGQCARQSLAASPLDDYTGVRAVMEELYSYPRNHHPYHRAEATTGSASSDSDSPPGVEDSDHRKLGTAAGFSTCFAVGSLSDPTVREVYRAAAHPGRIADVSEYTRPATADYREAYGYNLYESLQFIDKDQSWKEAHAYPAIADGRRGPHCYLDAAVQTSDEEGSVPSDDSRNRSDQSSSNGSNQSLDFPENDHSGDGAPHVLRPWFPDNPMMSIIHEEEGESNENLSPDSSHRSHSSVEVPAGEKRETVKQESAALYEEVKSPRVCENNVQSETPNDEKRYPLPLDKLSSTGDAETASNGRYFCLVSTPPPQEPACGPEDSCADEVCTCTDESLDSGVQEDLTPVRKSPHMVLSSGSFRQEDGPEAFNHVEEMLISEGCCMRLDSCRVQVIIAVDLGTAYSGYAFSFRSDPTRRIHIMRRPQGGDAGISNHKIPTTLLLTPKEEFHSFGFMARDFFHDLDAQEAKRWLYFDKFKMVLHNNQKIDRSTMVKAANGRYVSALTVLSHALRYLGGEALREVERQQPGIEMSQQSVRWVLTVPALWQPPARQLLREAAGLANIYDKEHPESLIIALEPEAASIYCRTQKLHHIEISSDLPLFEELENSGTRYMVVDCGGGTVDITVHELSSSRGTLRELHRATGGPWGSIGIDRAFEALLDEVFGEEFMEQFKLKRPAAFVELMVSFEARKRVASPYRETPFNIFPPFSFIDYYRKYKGKEIDHAVKKCGRKDISWSSQGMLRINASLMRELFQPTVSNILKYIQDVFDKSTVSEIKYLFLVGGFAESPILQNEVQQSFGSKVHIIIPQEMGLSILKGAVLFGMNPEVITVRYSKQTYAIGVLKPFIPGIHRKEKLIEKDGVRWCADVLDKFVEAEQPLNVGEAVVRRYTPAKSDQSSAVINIYCVDSEDAKYVTEPGVRRCGTLKLDLSHTERPAREIQICMVFGGTEVTASATDIASGNRVDIQVDFLSSS